MLTLEQFLAGEPLAYRTFSGTPVTARWTTPRDAPGGWLEVRDAAGNRLHWFAMPLHEARNFHAAILTDPTAYRIEV